MNVIKTLKKRKFACAGGNRIFEWKNWTGRKIDFKDDT